MRRPCTANRWADSRLGSCHGDFQRGDEHAMSRWLVSTIPPWLLLLGMVLAIAGISVAVQAYVRRRFPALAGDSHNDVTKFVFGVVSFVFAFFLGFLVSNLWGQISSADATAHSEGTTGVQLARDSKAFDEADGDRIRQSLLNYEQAAVTEWPLAARGQTSPAADEALGQLYAAYENVQTRTDAQKTLLSTSFANLNTLSQARTERVLTARTNDGPPGSLWAVIFLTSGLVLGCAIIYGVEKPGIHYPMVATVGALVAANLFLVLQLSHPYIGEIGTSPEPLREVIRVLTEP